MEWLTQRFELSRGGRSNLPVMEGLRGVAVFLVFLVHYVSLILPWIPKGSATMDYAEGVRTVGNSTGVDLFFVLSGYLIYGSLISRPQPLFRFMARRIVRIYPAFTVVFIAYVALSYLFPAESRIPGGTIDGGLYLLQNFLLLPGLLPIEPMITVAGSLSYEMFYYMTVPLLISLLRLRARRRRFRVLAFLSMATALALVTAVQGGPIRLIMFVAGILLYEALDSRIPSPGNLIGLTALLVALASPLLPLEGNAGGTVQVCILFVTFPVLCLVCFRESEGWLSRAFSWRPLRWFGNMSYSYFLLHGLVLKGALLLLPALLAPDRGEWWHVWALLPVMFLVTIIPSALLFLLIERPFSLAPRRAGGWATGESRNSLTDRAAPQPERG